MIEKLRTVREQIADGEQVEIDQMVIENRLKINELISCHYKLSKQVDAMLAQINALENQLTKE